MYWQTYDSTPAAMVLRMEAGIAILKPPAVGEEISWIALSIVGYGGLIQDEEGLLVIDWRVHDMTNDTYLQIREKECPVSHARVNLKAAK